MLANFKNLQLALIFSVLMMPIIGGPSKAASLDVPTGTPILTVSGNISNTNSGDKAVFDLKMIKSLEATVIKTTTPWNKEPAEFKGVLAKTFFELIGAKGDMVISKALNDFQVTMPLSEFYKNGVIIAYSVNGEDMSIRDKGPLMVVYPFDKFPELKSQKYYNRCIWQLVTMDIN